jgi:hypothetical protein
MERRPGLRFVSAILEIQGFDPERHRYRFESAYSEHEDRDQRSATA